MENDNDWSNVMMPYEWEVPEDAILILRRENGENSELRAYFFDGQIFSQVTPKGTESQVFVHVSNFRLLVFLMFLGGL